MVVKSLEEIKEHSPVVGSGLGLDSLDAVVIVIMLQRKYNIPQRDVDQKREVFATFATLSDFVQARSMQ